MDAQREIPIRGELIRLGQLLKVAGVVDSGAEAKELLASGAIRVNGERETRRGRQLLRGDIVATARGELRVV
ncbi:MAG: RNA-binding S4 domain-containing protein [Conexibacter sp.]